MKKWLLNTLLILLICLVIGLISAFVITFWSSGVSKSSAEWGQFGDYFGMIINLTGTVAIFILSYLVFKGQRERDKWEKDILELSDMPVLIFAADNNVYDKCLNVGKGAAHKVIIGKKAFNGTNHVIKSYSIPSNGYLHIKWANDPNELFAYYEGINGKKYLVRCVNDINSHLINGSTNIVGDPNEDTVKWLIQNANRHPGISLRMIET